MSLKITSQESLFNEVQFPDGQPIEVSYVVKRTPFEVFVEVEDVPYDFKTGKIECELFYAKPKEEKVLTTVSAIGTAGLAILEFPFQSSGPRRALSLSSYPTPWATLTERFRHSHL